MKFHSIHPKLFATLLILCTTVILVAKAGEKIKPKDQQETAIQRKLLSSHETVAQFNGITEFTCSGATEACPDRCGNSGDLATFKIIKYIAYENPGDGDPRQSKFQFLVQDNMKTLKVPAEIKKAVESLQVGDYVVLNWRHEYVTYALSKSPERPIQLIKPITKAEADKLPAAPEVPFKGEK